MGINIVAQNKKARHDYEILDTYEAGIVLSGSEVKALRAKRANLKDSYCKFFKNELFLTNAHISYLETVYKNFAPDTRIPRKLLLHKKELNKLFAISSQENLTIIPLMLYFNEKNKAKVQIALARGKKLYDKRADLKAKNLDMEAKQAIKQKNR